MIEPIPKTRPLTRQTRTTKVGDIRPEHIPLYVFEHTLAEALDHAATDLEREIGGFLLGGFHEHQGVYVEVRGFLPAAVSMSSATSVTFNHDTWARMTRDAEAHFPGDIVVGWMHTHPDLGVFLSAHDLFIHRNFFSQLWQVALVIDPIGQELGFFQWQDDRIVDCGFVCITA